MGDVGIGGSRNVFEVGRCDDRLAGSGAQELNQACEENDALEWVGPEAVPWDALAFQSTREALREWVAARGRTPGG